MTAQELWAIKKPDGSIEYGILMPTEQMAYEEIWAVCQRCESIERVKEKGYRAVRVFEVAE